MGVGGFGLAGAKLTTCVSTGGCSFGLRRHKVAFWISWYEFYQFRPHECTINAGLLLPISTVACEGSAGNIDAGRAARMCHHSAS